MAVGSFGSGSSGITTASVSSGGAQFGTYASLGNAIQTIWSKEILFQAMPILRFEQFAVKKTELGVQPGLTIHFMRYTNIALGGEALTEGVRMDTVSLASTQFDITVAENGKGVAVSELLLNASFDDVMASASRLLGRNMAQYLDSSARDTLYGSSATGVGGGSSGGLTNAAYGYDTSAFQASGSMAGVSPYVHGTSGAGASIQLSMRAMTGTFYLTVNTAKDAVETLASLNVPRLGETYVSFIHPHQSRRLRDDPEFIEVTKYAGPGNFMLGEIGRLNDVVYIETTQVRKVALGGGGSWTTDASGGNGAVPRYDGIMIGDNTFGHAIALPVELRDGGVLDFGREHALAWYSIWGWGILTAYAGVVMSTN